MSVVSMLCLLCGLISVFLIIELEWLRKPRRGRVLPPPPWRPPSPRKFSRVWFADIWPSLLLAVILLAVALLVGALFGH